MKKKLQTLTLANGSKIAVIGAGPAGTFFADLAIHMAQERGLDISVVLFDGKDFTQRGPKGCNLCAGVISETLETRLKERGIALPEEKVQRKINGYYLQGRTGGILLTHPLNKSRITTVFRGNGPRLSREKGNVSFDDHLLEHVRRRGAKVIRRLVKRVELPQDPEDPVKIIYGIGKEESTFEADLVVGAFGLSMYMMKKIQNLNFGYRPPHTVRARNVEIRLNRGFIQETFGGNIFTYNMSTIRKMFVACLIPKKDYMTVNMIGRRDVKEEELAHFLDFLVVHKKLPKDWSSSDNVCTCTPRIAIRSAKKPFTDRLVIIGDASCSRYYKNGIESAFVTSKLAAETAFNLGISESAFKAGYYSRIKKIIVKDNFYGRILIKINDLATGNAFLSEVMLNVAREKANKMRDVLWNTYTGNIPYKAILLKFINPVLQWQLAATTFKLIFRSILSKSSIFFKTRGNT